MADDIDSSVDAIAREQGFELDELGPDLAPRTVALLRDGAIETLRFQMGQRLGRRQAKRLRKHAEAGDWHAMTELICHEIPAFDPEAALHANVVEGLLLLRNDSGTEGQLPTYGQVRAYAGPCPLFGCAMSPDGATLAAGSDDSTVVLFETATGDRRDPLRGHTAAVFTCAFSPDGTLLASGSADATAKLWDLDSGLSSTLVGHDQRIPSCAFSPDGATLATASIDGTVRLWDVASASEKATLRGHEEGVAACAFAPDGRTLLSGGVDCTLKLWDVESLSEVRSFTGHENGITCCVFAPDGSFAVSSSGDMTLRVWDVETGETRTTITSHRASVHACALLAGGELLASCDQDGMLRIHNPASGAQLAVTQAHIGAAVGCVPGSAEFARPLRASSTDLSAGVLATSGVDETIRLWSLAAMLEVLG